MKTLVAILGLVSLGGLTQAESTTPFSAVPPAVVFSASTVPEIAGVKASCEVVQVGEEWRIVTMVVNGTSRQAKFKLVLVMEPGIPADRYLVPGFNYNGNEYGKNMPQGWEKDGDRASIPACTVSENKTDVFGLYASDADPASITSACSMEKRKDGSFRHLIYWPVTEAPFAYTDKLKLNARIDNYLTLNPGETFTARAFACHGKPRWPNFGFEVVFRSAWRNLKHDCPPGSSATITTMARTTRRWATSARSTAE